MIPRIIHYCWFGGHPLPKESVKYIKSWQKYFPGWEIKRWDENNFNVNAIPYTAEAYKAHKYAFVSDYARYKIIYENGGVYFDTDVEVIRDMSDIIAAGAFMGCEHPIPDITIAPGLGIGAPAGHPFYKKMLNFYESKQFTFSLNDNIVSFTTTMLKEEGLTNILVMQSCAGINIYPPDFFCPIDFTTRKIDITENTRTIHHYAESWLPKKVRIINRLGRIFGTGFINFFVKLKRHLRNQ